MANEMDELLAELKAEYEPKKTRAKSQSAPPPKPSSSRDNVGVSEFDELLADVKREAGAEVKPSRLERSPANQSKSSTLETEAVGSQQFYEKLRQQQRAREREAAQKRQQEAAIAAQKRAEHRELRRKAALQEKAREWLKNLDFGSEEGKWFEDFSHSYDSQLDAAIDYLQAMRESGL